MLQVFKAIFFFSAAGVSTGPVITGTGIKSKIS